MSDADDATKPALLTVAQLAEKYPGNTVPLGHPIKFGKEEIAELKYRRPIARDFRHMKAENPTMGDMLKLAGAIFGKPDAVIDLLDVDDMQNVLEVVASFMQTGQETGAT